MDIATQATQVEEAMDLDQSFVESEDLNPFDLYVVIKHMLNFMTNKQILQMRKVNKLWNLAAVAVLSRRKVVVGIECGWKPEPEMEDFVEFQRMRRTLPSEGQLKYTDFKVSCGRHQTCTMLTIAFSERLLDAVTILELRYIPSAECNSWIKFALRNLPNLQKLKILEFSTQVHTPLQNELDVSNIGEDWHSNLTALNVTYYRRDDGHEVLCWDFVKFCPKLEDLQIHYRYPEHVRESLNSLNQLLPAGQCFKNVYIMDLLGSTLDRCQDLTMGAIHTFLNKFPVRNFALNLNTSLTDTTEFQNRLWPSPSNLKSIWWTSEVRNWESSASQDQVFKFFRSFGPAMDSLENVRLAFRVLFSLDESGTPVKDVCQYIKPAPKVKFLEFLVRDQHNVQYGNGSFMPPPQCVYWFAQTVPKVFPNLQRISCSLTDSSEVKWFLEALAQVPTIELVCLHKQHVSRMNTFLNNEVLFGFNENGVRDKDSNYKGLLALPNLHTLYLYDAYAVMNLHSMNLGFVMIPKLKKFYLQLRSTTWNTVKSSCFWPAFSRDVKIIYIPPRPTLNSSRYSFYNLQQTMNNANAN